MKTRKKRGRTGDVGQEDRNHLPFFAGRFLIASSVQFHKQQRSVSAGRPPGSWSVAYEQGAGKKAARLKGPLGRMLTSPTAPFFLSSCLYLPWMSIGSPDTVRGEGIETKGTDHLEMLIENQETISLPFPIPISV